MNQFRSIQRENANGNSSRWMAIGRWSAIAGGGALAVLGLSRRSKSGAALAAVGGTLEYLGTRLSTVPGHLTARGGVSLNCPPTEAYRFVDDFESLPRLMR